MATQSLTDSSGVYRIINCVNGKCYVGSSKNLSRRKKDHMRLLESGTHHSTKLKNSLRKYGLLAFEFEVLEHCEVDVLLIREAHWMAVYDTVNSGYNMRRDPSTNLGVRPSAEARRKMSEAQKGRVVPEHVRQKMSEATRGRDMSRQVQISAENRRGKPLPHDTRRKISEALADKPKSTEHVAKVAAANKGVTRSEETRRRISEAQLGRKVPESVLEKRRGRKQSPEAVAKRTAKLRGVQQANEHVEKRMAATAKTKGLDSNMRGVSFHKKRQQWRARVTVGGKETHLGWFASQEAAAEARAAYLLSANHFLPQVDTIALTR